MTTIDALAISKQRALFARLTALLLMALVLSGAVGTFAHNHSNGINALLATASTPPASDSNDNGSTSKTLPGGGECLVCQLHHHLFTGLLTALPHIAPPLVQSANETATEPFFITQTFALQRGRAPPLHLS